MRIITKGKLPEDALYEVICQHCKTVFEFERREAKFTSDQRDGDYLIIICPVCNSLIYKGI